uniref:Uncharacterized protein n=2 Tax=Oryza sativa subsp. japonica TaxID=39947 RepID=Q2R9E0_ORYSJ|nr:hypothetical protein LOC_Os11g09080 [Oryza sativa Japonica Group]ABA91880.1 hypothetical protein LOC_Os11g09080 [Oryza sativa Japonica Group]
MADVNALTGVSLTFKALGIIGAGGDDVVASFDFFELPIQNRFIGPQAAVSLEPSRCAEILKPIGIWEPLFRSTSKLIAGEI